MAWTVDVNPSVIPLPPSSGVVLQTSIAKAEGKEFEDINSVQAIEALDNLFTKYNFLKASFYRTHPKRALARKFDLV